MVLLGILVCVFVIIQVVIRLGLSRIEQQPYSVEVKFRNFEIRKYPEALVAVTVCTGNHFRQVARSGFSKIAQFIFGRNSTGKKIAMTAPVRMEFGKENSTIEFIMPASYSKTTLPQTLDESVQIKTWAGGYYAAIKFGGFPNDEKIRKATENLKQALIFNDIGFEDLPKYLGYNPPYQIFFRRNEVILPVSPREGKMF
jgi:hypothetical protein